jgi:hypothetical protein
VRLYPVAEGSGANVVPLSTKTAPWPRVFLLPYQAAIKRNNKKKTDKCHELICNDDFAKP